MQQTSGPLWNEPQELGGVQAQKVVKHCCIKLHVVETPSGLQVMLCSAGGQLLLD